MRFMKKVLSVVLCLVSVLTIFYIQTSAKTFTEGDFEYEINENPAKTSFILTHKLL